MKAQLKTITVSYSFVVVCTTEQDADQVAREHLREALSDIGAQSDDVTIRLSDYATRKPSGWTGMCIPYGGDGNTTTDEHEAQDE